MARSRRHEIGVGLLMVVALAVLAVMAVQVGALRGLGDQVRVQVAFEDVNGLTEGAVVAVAGVEVGEVESMDVQHDHAIVKLSIDADAGVRTDALARVRSRSVLGEKFVAIEPRSREAPLVQEGDTLQSSGPQTDMDEVVDSLGPIMSALDPAVVRRSMEVLSRSLEEDPERVARMLENLDRILANGAEASDDLPAMVAEGRRAVAEVDARARELEPVIARADSVLADLDQVSGDLPALVDDVEALVGETRVVVGHLEESSDDLKVVLDNLSEIDKWELRRLLREEGVLMRLKEHEVQEPGQER